MCTMTIRKPAVAGYFYPDSKSILLAEVDSCLQAQTDTPKTAKLAIMPHAGYVYSGKTAGMVAAAINVPDIVILLCPKHTHAGKTGAVSAVDTWQMPMGDIPVNQEMAQTLVDTSPLMMDDLAHMGEHSLEVQLPFLWRRNPNLTIVPIALGLHQYHDLETIADGIAQLIRNSPAPVLMVASTDMSHQIPLSLAEKLDHMAIDQVLALNPKGLYDTVFENDITMCGVIPTTTALIAANQLGAKEAHVINYTTSAEATGDTSRVVGYAGIVVN